MTPKLLLSTRLRGLALLTFVTLASLCSGAACARHEKGAGAKSSSPAPVRKAKIVILSTMLADSGIGEWGFSALVEVEGKRILFDTGFERDTVLKNARALSIDLSDVEDVILSHNHDDHTGGLISLREELAKKNPKALSTAHVGRGIFARRRGAQGDQETNPMIATKERYEATGGAFVEHEAPVELAPGVWLTGPVPRRHPERNWSGQGKIVTDGGLVEDTIPEDQSLILDTDKGLVLISGCGHSGIINTLELARAKIRSARVYAAIGGFHLFAASDATLDWTAGELRRMELTSFVGAHCTGLEAVYQLRAKVGLARETCVVGAVGATFDLTQGINPGVLAK